MACSGHCGCGGTEHPLVQLCHPVRGLVFHQSALPPGDGCGVFAFELADYPLNQASLYQPPYWQFGASEMVLVQYSGHGGDVVFRIFDPDGNEIYNGSEYISSPHGSAWTVAGRFNSESGFSGDEIITRGMYLVEVETSYVRIDVGFEVI